MLGVAVILKSMQTTHDPIDDDVTYVIFPFQSQSYGGC